MITIFVTIEASTLAVDVKAELKDLAAQIIEAQVKEEQALKELVQSKSGINEHKYSKQLSAPISVEDRNELLTEQFAYRNWFTNAVLRTYELRRLLQSLTKQAEAQVAQLAVNADPGDTLALVSMLNLARAKDYSRPEEILSEFDKVADVSSERIREATCVIFASKKKGAGALSRPNFTSSELEIFEPNAAQVKLKAAVQAAREIREKCERLRWSFIYGRKQVRQITQRIEQAHIAGANAEVATIINEKSNADAHLFVVASLYEAAHVELLKVESDLAEAIKTAASVAGDHTTLIGLTAMSNCVGAWHWLGELTGYTENNYRDCNPGKVLAELQFDSATYVGR